jgi:hypothetical protein
VIMGAAVWVCRWLIRTYLAWPGLALLAAEIPLGLVVYAIFAWPDVRWLLHGGLRVRGEGPVGAQAHDGVREAGA